LSKHPQREGGIPRGTGGGTPQRGLKGGGFLLCDYTNIGYSLPLITTFNTIKIRIINDNIK